MVFHSEEKRRVRLDVYRSRERPADGQLLPAVIQVHGGGWILGSRAEQGIPLLNHLAANGWIGFNVDYRLSPRATLPEHVVDVKRAIAWVREHADELGVDPGRIAITGGSAGGHLTRSGRADPERPGRFSPGFEDADTSVMAAVPFYGVYDLHDEARRYHHLHDWLFSKVVLKQRVEDAPDLYRDVSPTHRVTEDAPPFLIFHGDQDTLVPVDDARDVRQAPRGGFAQRRPLRRDARRRARLRHLPVATHRPGRRVHRAVPAPGGCRVSPCDPPRRPGRRRAQGASPARTEARQVPPGARRGRHPDDPHSRPRSARGAPPRLAGQRRDLARGARAPGRDRPGRHRLRPAGLRRRAAPGPGQRPGPARRLRGGGGPAGGRADEAEGRRGRQLPRRLGRPPPGRAPRPADRGRRPDRPGGNPDGAALLLRGPHPGGVADHRHARSRAAGGDAQGRRAASTARSPSATRPRWSRPSWIASPASTSSAP